jgi:phosphatidylglycerol---prolipoprotein diacylglyceryl transferase
MLAVRLVKYRMGVRTRKGDYLVPGIALGIAIGRIGCFLRGCCYGTVTTLPWGVDFGDGLRRHPTELYEAALCLGWFVFSRTRPKTDTGVQFDRFLLGYFALRFFLEFIRTEPVVFLGLTVFQLVCILVVVWISFRIRSPLPRWKT